MKTQLVGMVTLAGALLSGCNGTGVIHTNSVQARDQPRLETRIFYGPCVRPTSQKAAESFSFGEVFGGSIISNTLGRIGKALRNAGEPDPYNETTSLNLEVEPGKLKPCIQIVKGRFGKAASESLTNLNFLEEAVVLEGVSKDTAEKITPDIVLNNLNHAGVYLQSDPAFFFEGSLRPSENMSALVLVPSFYTYLVPFKPGRSSSSTYAVLVSVSFHSPGKAANSQGAAGVSLALGALQPGEKSHHVYPQPIAGEPNPHESPWFPSFVKASAVASKTPLAGSKGNVDKPQPNSNVNGPASIPMVLTASVTETSQANDVLIFFADVFDASKNQLQTSLAQELISSAADAADFTDYKNTQASLADYYAKFAAAESALAVVCSLSADENSSKSVRLTASAKLFGAQSAANVAARIANLPLLYPALVEVTDKRLSCSA